MKRIKSDDTNFVDMQYDVINNAIHIISDNLNKQFEEYIVNGLKRKGFEFNNQTELEVFIKEHCICVDNTDLKQRVYHVDNIPFLLHNYESNIITDWSMTDRNYKIVGDFGTFCYM